MPAAPEISEVEIAWAEQQLLPPGSTFDAERREFIRRLDTLDLQAVPGSGKTTALLAKLAILERHLPFADGSGILVLSHTNAAVDEISDSIGPLCPRLFCYPNFVGTIQSFVDQFLAIPYYCSRQRKRPHRIHNDLYVEQAGAFMTQSLKDFSIDEQKRAKSFLAYNQCADSMRFAPSVQPALLVSRINGRPLIIAKPRRGKAPYADWSEEERRRVRAWLVAFKYALMKEGVLCFDDAYFLAHRLLDAFPAMSGLLRRRFRHVFVDEMQDMGQHQHDLLELLFATPGDESCGYQRIGDRNQAIHNERDVGDETSWSGRTPTLTLTNSLRLTPQTAAVVSWFALENEPGFRINGIAPPGPSPTLIVYTDTTAKGVLKQFSALVRAAAEAGHIPLTPDSRIRAIAWNTVWRDNERAQGKLRLVDYCPEFSRRSIASRLEYPNLEALLRAYHQPESDMRRREAAILNIFLTVLRMERMFHPELGTPFTRLALFTHLRDKHPEFYASFRLSLFRWCLASANDELARVIKEIRDYVPAFLETFGGVLVNAKTYVAETATEASDEPGAGARSNIVNLDGFNIELSSVHAVKGQTHTATLYFETAYHQDGRGPAARCYESQRLAPQFLCNRLIGSEGAHVKQSAKMVYVGFSRPTHLLCFAVHRERYNAYLRGIAGLGWKVVELE